jgi:hypothetical protein
MNNYVFIPKRYIANSPGKPEVFAQQQQPNRLLQQHTVHAHPSAACPLKTLPLSMWHRACIIPFMQERSS